MHSTLLALMAIQSIVHYASAEAESRRLQTKLYQAEELAEDTLKSYFNLLELSMSISLTSGSPSSVPSLFQGSASPTPSPSPRLTNVPSKSPSTAPQLQESSNPTSGPTGTPTSLVTNVPTAFPTSLPMLIPSPNPTSLPSSSPSSRPTTLPSSQSPSLSPSNPPTLKCNLTESERRDALSNIIKSISSPAEVDTIGTPQNLSSNWLINIDSSYICPDDQNVAQRYIMGVFYYSTRGDRWRQCQAPIDLDDLEAIEDANLACNISAPIGGGSNAWLTPSNECTWGGLLCDSTSSIATIDFEQNGVAGTLPHELENLSTLRYLLLEEGVLTGTIPSELGNIKNLERIDLNFNLLSGSIPEELYGLTNLEQLDLNDNELEGSISSSISNLSRLSFFSIENNKLTGTVPVELGSLLSLEVASMYSNQLSGTMPDEVCANVSPLGLQVLTTDCQGAPNRPSPPLVVCACCTGCF